MSGGILARRVPVGEIHGEAEFAVEVAGMLPEQAWTIDASIHFAGKASYKY